MARLSTFNNPFSKDKIKSRPKFFEEPFDSDMHHNKAENYHFMPTLTSFHSLLGHISSKSVLSSRG